MFAILVAFVTPLHAVVGIMMFFLFADTFSAVYLHYKNIKKRVPCDEKENIVVQKARCMALFWRVIDRDKFNRTVEKFFVYPAIAITCYVFDVLVLRITPSEEGLVGMLTLTNLAMTLIAFMDFRSFMRNMGRATGITIFVVLENALSKKIKDRFGDMNDEKDTDQTDTQQQE